MPISVEPYKPILVHNDCSIEIAEDGEPLEFSTNFFVPFSVSRIEIQSIVKDAANLLPYLLRVQLEALWESGARSEPFTSILPSRFLANWMLQFLKLTRMHTEHINPWSL